MNALIVCGLHRSGTSLCSHFLSENLGLPLVDDPKWAINVRNGPLLLRKGDRFGGRVLKIPRAAEYMEFFVSERALTFIFCFRNPLDVFSSIVDAQLSDDETVFSMLDYHRVPRRGNKSIVEQYCRAYNFYCDQILNYRRKRECVLVEYSEMVSKPAKILRDATRVFPGFRVPSGLQVLMRRVDPEGNKPREQQMIRGEKRWMRDLPPIVANEIRGRTMSAFEAYLGAQ